jgi:hypothetical protein
MFLTQVHGLAHSDSGDHDRNHRCSICKTISNQLISVPAISDVNYKLQLVSEKTVLGLDNNFCLIQFISKSTPPRAPPKV